MPPLQRTFSFAQVNHVAVAVAQHLNFDVPRLFDVFFDEHAVVAERGAGFARGPLESVAALVVVAGEPHPLAAAAGAGFEHHRIADLVGDDDRMIGVANDVGMTGNRVHAGLARQSLRRDLVAHAPSWPAAWDR